MLKLLAEIIGREGAEFRGLPHIYYCLLAVLKMYAIYVPHLTEYIYQKGFRELVVAGSGKYEAWFHVSAKDLIACSHAKKLVFRPE